MQKSIVIIATTFVAERAGKNIRWHQRNKIQEHTAVLDQKQGIKKFEAYDYNRRNVQIHSKETPHYK